MNWWDWFLTLFKSKATIERPSPKIRIKPEQVHIVNGTLQVTGLQGCFIAAIDVTNSLDPTIDNGMFVVLQSIIDVDDLIVGDIVWYETSTYKAIHRINQIDSDKDGWFCITKGDNNSRDDGIKVRTGNLKGVWRATID